VRLGRSSIFGLARARSLRLNATRASISSLRLNATRASISSTLVGVVAANVRVREGLERGPHRRILGWRMASIGRLRAGCPQATQRSWHQSGQRLGRAVVFGLGIGRHIGHLRLTVRVRAGLACRGGHMKDEGGGECAH
jgi:hypothetical protein